MNDEERQRTMDFILNQQAKFSSDLEKSEARISRLERTLRLALRAGLRERREWRERYSALVDAQIRTEDSTRGHDDRLARVERAVEHATEAAARAGEAAERANGAAERANEASRRNSEDINGLLALTERNSEDINRLAKIVERNITGHNGGGDAE